MRLLTRWAPECDGSYLSHEGTSDDRGESHKTVGLWYPHLVQTCDIVIHEIGASRRCQRGVRLRGSVVAAAWGKSLFTVLNLGLRDELKQLYRLSIVLQIRQDYA